MLLLAKNFEACVAEAGKRDRHLIGAVVGAHGQTVEREHDVAGTEDVARPLRDADDEQAPFATVPEVCGQLRTDGHHTEPGNIDGNAFFGITIRLAPRDGGRGAWTER